MKTLRAACLIGLLPVLALAQPEPPKPVKLPVGPPFEPVLPENHQGDGRLGLRIDYNKDNGIPTIVALIRGGPAEDFGFRVGDHIIKIDKNFTDTLSLDQIRLALHGKPGSPVQLTIQRDDDPHLIIRSLTRRTLAPDAQEMVNPPMSEVMHPPDGYFWL